MAPETVVEELSALRQRNQALQRELESKFGGSLDKILGEAGSQAKAEATLQRQVAELKAELAEVQRVDDEEIDRLWKEIAVHHQTAEKLAQDNQALKKSQALMERRVKERDDKRQAELEKAHADLQTAQADLSKARAELEAAQKRTAQLLAAHRRAAIASPAPAASATSAGAVAKGDAAADAGGVLGAEGRQVRALLARALPALKEVAGLKATMAALATALQEPGAYVKPERVKPLETGLRALHSLSQAQGAELRAVTPAVQERLPALEGAVAQLQAHMSSAATAVAFQGGGLTQLKTAHDREQARLALLEGELSALRKKLASGEVAGPKPPPGPPPSLRAAGQEAAAQMAALRDGAAAAEPAGPQRRVHVRRGGPSPPPDDQPSSAGGLRRVIEWRPEDVVAAMGRRSVGNEAQPNISLPPPIALPSISGVAESAEEGEVPTAASAQPVAAVAAPVSTKEKGHCNICELDFEDKVAEYRHVLDDPSHIKAAGQIYWGLTGIQLPNSDVDITLPKETLGEKRKGRFGCEACGVLNCHFTNYLHHCWSARHRQKVQRALDRLLEAGAAPEKPRAVLLRPRPAHPPARPPLPAAAARPPPPQPAAAPPAVAPPPVPPQEPAAAVPVALLSVIKAPAAADAGGAATRSAAAGSAALGKRAAETEATSQPDSKKLRPVEQLPPQVVPPASAAPPITSIPQQQCFQLDR